MDRNGRGVSDGGAGLARILCFAAGAALAMLPDRGVGQTTTRVSVDSAGVEGNGSSADPHTNGSQVAFESDATNLVPADSNDRLDVFVHDLETGVTSRVSVASSGAQADGDSEDASLDGKGRPSCSNRMRRTWFRGTRTARPTSSCTTARRGRPRG
jgi:hypothetical protein